MNVLRSLTRITRPCAQLARTMSDESPRSMERCVNEVTLMGRVGRDAELRGREDMNQVAVFSLATNYRIRKKDTGEITHDTDWHNIVVFNPFTRDFVASKIKKGDRLLIQGQLSNKKYEDPTTNERKTVSRVIARNVINLTQKWRNEEQSIPGDEQEYENQDQSL